MKTSFSRLLRALYFITVGLVVFVAFNMPFKDAFKGITKEFDSLRQDLSRKIQPSSNQNQGQQSGYPGQQYGGYGQQQQQFSPPPVPYASHPGASQPSQAALHQPPQQAFGPPGVYWRAKFDPNRAVSEEWEHKQGDHGWGNNELQNYIDSPQNSFYSGDGKLVLRAISQGGRYTSARLVSRQRLSEARGCLTAWLTSPCASGIWPAFWLLPFEPFTWPTDGEVDIAETWNGDLENHSCLHWGFYTPEDGWKHRVRGTRISDMAKRAVKYEFAWDQDEQGGGKGRLVWWIDGRPIMKAPIPDGQRPMRDFQVIVNIAMGGNVCQGQRPRDGTYDFVVHEVSMSDEPEGGWGRFERDWQHGSDGHTL